ncbi:MAG: hypothetical protein IPG66_18490 [Hydrogenophilales bacterium]|nr:hypothetical protein [Hydrogenophilales bacterium]
MVNIREEIAAMLQERQAVMKEWLEVGEDWLAELSAQCNLRRAMESHPSAGSGEGDIRFGVHAVICVRRRVA